MAVIIQSHEEDPPLACTPEYIEKDLKRSLFWHDLENWLNGRIELHQRELENSVDMLSIKRSQGIIQNCRDILDLPDAWLTELEAAQQNEDLP